MKLIETEVPTCLTLGDIFTSAFQHLPRTDTAKLVQNETGHYGYTRLLDGRPTPLSLVIACHTTTIIQRNDNFPPPPPKSIN